MIGGLGRKHMRAAVRERIISIRASTAIHGARMASRKASEPVVDDWETVRAFSWIREAR
jgi:hypothetical protein